MTKYIAIPNTHLAHQNLLSFQQAANEYIASLSDGGRVEECVVDLGEFSTEIYYRHPIGGERLQASISGEVRRLGTDGKLHLVLDQIPPVKYVARMLATGRTQAWGVRLNRYQISLV